MPPRDPVDVETDLRFYQRVLTALDRSKFPESAKSCAEKIAALEIEWSEFSPAKIEAARRRQAKLRQQIAKILNRPKASEEKMNRAQRINMMASPANNAPGYIVRKAFGLKLSGKDGMVTLPVGTRVAASEATAWPNFRAMIDNHELAPDYTVVGAPVAAEANPKRQKYQRRKVQVEAATPAT